MGADVSVCLTDHCPNLEAFERAHQLSQQAITYHQEPVDAAHVPSELSGFRTIFTAFHHFRPDQARAVLDDAVAKGEGIGVFECAQRSLLMVFLTLPTPIRVLAVTPFIRPFRWSRLFWTYLIPVVPIVLWFDSIVSALWVYSVEELRGLTVGLTGYRWDVRKARSGWLPITVTYLIGVPERYASAVATLRIST